MKRRTEIVLLIAAAFFIVLNIGSLPVMAFDVITIVGEVNGANQIVSDGEVFQVDDTPQGDDLLKNYIGQKVKVTGKLRIEGDMRIIDVTKFEVIKELL